MSFDIKNLNGRPLRLLIGGSPCVPAGTKIKVKEGYKNIEDIVVGDEVLTHKNRYRKVTDTMQRQTDSLYHIKFNGSETINITGNHPLYVFKNNNIEWIRCDELRVGDYVCCNINQNQDESIYTNEELWLMGRLLADGYRDKSRSRVFFSIAKKKTEEFEKHINQSGYKYYITHKDRQAPEYVIENADFYKKCLILKDGAANKYVPDNILNLNDNSLKCFVDGYLSGDGHKRKDRKETYMWSTISMDMVLSVAMAILKIHKKYPTVTKKIEKKKYKIWSNGRISNTSDSYNSQIALSTNRTAQKVIKDKVFIPIKEITKEYVNCKVFNISVKEDESYTVNNVIVHNCTYWSIAQKNNRETEAKGLGWELFKNYLIAKEKFKPDLFLYENNKSASQEIKDQIVHELGYPLQVIDSALVSAQKRLRFYVKNWECPLPQDRGILLKDILELSESVVEKEKAYCLCTDHVGTTRDYFKKHQSQIVFEPVRIGDIGSNSQGYRVYSCYGKSICLTATGGGIAGKTGLYFTPLPEELEKLTCDKGKIYKVDNHTISTKFGDFNVNLPDGLYIIRKLTVTEAARLQTMPDDYMKAVSAQQGYKGLGNGWTAEVIIHQFKYGLKNVPKDYPIEVLSMYDGIGTGRYCLDKLGYTNITYKAYEIDKYAITVANDNYPDIIQCGDAFELRNDDWKY